MTFLNTGLGDDDVTVTLSHLDDDLLGAQHPGAYNQNVRNVDLYGGDDLRVCRPRHRRHHWRPRSCPAASRQRQQDAVGAVRQPGAPRRRLGHGGGHRAPHLAEGPRARSAPRPCAVIDGAPGRRRGHRDRERRGSHGHPERPDPHLRGRAGHRSGRSSRIERTTVETPEPPLARRRLRPRLRRRHASTLPLIVFGGQDDDTILTGGGGDIVFGDRGRAYYGGLTDGAAHRARQRRPRRQDRRHVPAGRHGCSPSTRRSAAPTRSSPATASTSSSAAARGDTIDVGAGNDLVLGDHGDIGWCAGGALQVARAEVPTTPSAAPTDLRRARRGRAHRRHRRRRHRRRRRARPGLRRQRHVSTARQLRQPHQPALPACSTADPDLQHRPRHRRRSPGRQRLAARPDAGAGVGRLPDHAARPRQPPPTHRLFGNDYIAGGAGDDMIFGQLGNDVIQGDGSIDWSATTGSLRPTSASTAYRNDARPRRARVDRRGHATATTTSRAAAATTSSSATSARTTSSAAARTCSRLDRR